jgi:hypothetical protein
MTEEYMSEKVIDSYYQTATSATKLVHEMVPGNKSQTRKCSLNLLFLTLDFRIYGPNLIENYGTINLVLY